MENETQNSEEIKSENEQTQEQEATVEAPKKVKKPINMAKGGLLWSIWSFLEAALILVLGIICFVFTAKAASNDSDLSYDRVISVILLIAGIFLIVGGALKIIVNFMPIVTRNALDAAVKAMLKSQLSYDMVITGAIELSLGIALIVSYCKYNGTLNEMVGFIASFLAIFIGVIVIAAGASLVLFAIGFIVSKLYKIYLPILEIVFGLALIALGIVVLYFLGGNADLTKMISLIVLGIILVLAGLAVAVMTVIEINKARAKKAVVAVANEVVSEAAKAIEGEVVDHVEGEENEDNPEEK